MEAVASGSNISIVGRLTVGHRKPLNILQGKVGWWKCYLRNIVGFFLYDILEQGENQGRKRLIYP